MVLSGVRSPALATALCLFLLCATPAYAGGLSPGSPPAAASTPGTPATTHSTEISSVGLPSETNNSTQSQHTHPEQTSETGDRADVQAWLTQQLGTQLQQSTLNLTQAEYDQAQAVLGEQFDTRLEKYVTVANKTADTKDNQIATEFKTIKQQQQNFSQTVARYRTVQEQYRAAQRQGNETRARQLARELAQLHTQLQQTNTTLTHQYQTLANLTGTNFTRTQQTITTVTQNITTQQATIRNETFVQTHLTLNRTSPTASFRQPIVLTGTLTAANGTPIANRTLVAAVGPQRIQTQTNATGAFRVRVRPTLVERGTQPITVTYQPQATAIYLGARAQVPINITQVTPTVTLAHSTATAAFNDTVAVQGRIHVAEHGAAGVPVRITIGTTVVATVQTDANGSFTVSQPLPADVAVGDQQLHVTVPVANQALAATTRSVPITITETATQLTVTRTRTSTTQARITGTLTTAAHRPLAHQPIRIQIRNRTIHTVTTNATGGFTIPINTSTLTATSNKTVNVTAVYPGTANLEAAHASVSLALPADQTATGGETQPPTGLQLVLAWLPSDPWTVALGLGFLGLCLGGLLVARHRGVRSQDHDPADTAPAATVATSDAQSTPQPTATAPKDGDLLDHAATQLAETQPDAAVQTAYIAVRHQLHDELTDDPVAADAWTHWEFYQVATESAAISEAECDALHQLTEAYEQAQFTTATLPTDTATTAVATARSLLASAPDDEQADRPDESRATNQAARTQVHPETE